MPSIKLNFTKDALIKVSLPQEGKRFYVYDSKESGLVLDVTSTGSKSFYLYKRVGGRPERIFLGKFPDITINAARKAAAERKGEIARGINPREKMRSIRSECTFGDLCTQFIERHSKVNKKTWKAEENDIKRFLAKFFSMKASNITRRDCQNLHERIRAESGPYQANRQIERLRAIYNKAIEWGWEGSNPAKNIKKYKEKSRERYLSPTEVGPFLKALSEEQNIHARDFVLLLLLTGVRKSNVLALRWEQVDFENEFLRLDETKNGESYLVPLSKEAMQILSHRHLGQVDGWVFEGSGREGHLLDPRKTWKRVLKRAKIRNLRMHDLRRTLGSWQAMQGASLPVIGKSLGHRSNEATTVYARFDIQQVRESVQAATTAIYQSTQ